MQGSFDRFTERARRVLTFAQEEAQRLNHDYIGTEHILLGLVREGGGIAARVLSNLGIELTAIHAAVEQVVGRGERQVKGDTGLTPRGKKAIELAVDEARKLGHPYIGTEHLLLGLIRERESVAASVLESQGVNLERVRSEVMKVLETTLTEQGIPAGARSHGADGTTFNHFTERARSVLTLAHEEAQRHNHTYIGTEHLLLGLIREGEGAAARVLSNLGIELTKILTAVEFIIGRGEHQVMVDIGLTPAGKKVIELAVDEARRLGHHYVGTEHLLLGLIREGEGIAAGVLESLGLSTERARSEVIYVLTSSDEAARPRARVQAAFAPRSGPVSGAPPRWRYLTVPTVARDGVPRVELHSADPDVPTELMTDMRIHHVLDVLGRAGWELVGVIALEAEPGHALYVFRRPA